MLPQMKTHKTLKSAHMEVPGRPTVTQTQARRPEFAGRDTHPHSSFSENKAPKRKMKQKIKRHILLLSDLWLIAVL